MIRTFTTLSLALVASAAWASVRFPTDGDISSAVGTDDIASQIEVPVTITVKPLAQVSAARVYLQDVATCIGPEFVCSEVLAMDVDESAAPGRTKSIPIDRLRHLLNVEFPHYSLNMDGPSMARVESQFIEVGKDEIEEALRAALLTRLNENESLRLRSLNVQMPRALKAWPGDYRLHFPVIQNAQIQHLDWVVEHMLTDTSWSAVYDPLTIGANRRSTFRFTVHLEIETQVPVARTHIARGSKIAHDDLEYQWVRVGRQTIGRVREIKNVVGLLTKNSVRSGQPLSYRMLEVPEVVARGEKVKLKITRTGLNITAEGKALKSGGVGQSIAVYYPATKKTLQGEVLADGTVEVNL